MRFNEDFASKVNVIRGYGSGELRVNGEVFRCSLIVAASSIQPEPLLTAVADLSPAHAKYLQALGPEVVLIGTGVRQSFPDAAFGAQFLRTGIGYEVMDTGAACRTYNVLVGEQRRVAAVLIV